MSGKIGAEVPSRSGTNAAPRMHSRALPYGGEEVRKDRSWGHLEGAIAAFTTAAILLHLSARFIFKMGAPWYLPPLYASLALGGVPLLVNLLRKILAREFGSDLIAGISIVTAVILGEYLVASIVVLMLSGGVTLEQYATRRSSAVLSALARRRPQIAHRKSDSGVSDVSLDR